MVGNVCAEVNPIRWWISMPCKSDVRQLSSVFMFFPTCQVRAFRFYSIRVTLLLPSFLLPSSLPSSFFLVPSSFLLPPSSFLPQLQAPDLSGHCRTSTASFRFQWALPDLNCKLQILVASAGPQWAVPGFNCELQMWALPDMECKNRTSDGMSERMPEWTPD